MHVLENGFILDNWENILANKLTAVIGRDNSKDIFDIYLICQHYSFEWSDILDAAHDKSGFTDEDLIVRLKSFPSALFTKINIIDKDFLNNFERDLPLIILEIEQKASHSL